MLQDLKHYYPKYQLGNFLVNKSGAHTHNSEYATYFSFTEINAG